MADEYNLQLDFRTHLDKEDPLKRHILIGTPGSGKTFIIRASEMNGHIVVDEAATDIIAMNNHSETKSPGVSKFY